MSTSLDRSIAERFSVNVIMEIKVPVNNLKGIFDNGFANVTTFSFSKSEKEILFNAFNIFKIIAFKKASKN